MSMAHVGILNARKEVVVTIIARYIGKSNLDCFSRLTYERSILPRPDVC